MKEFLALVLLLCVVGCSPQKDLARRLKEADRVIVTNSFEDHSITVTGEDVDRLVQVIASGKKASPLIKSGPVFNLEFFKGTQHVETVAASTFLFMVGNDPYLDTTKTLQSLSERLYETNRPRLRR